MGDHGSCLAGAAAPEEPVLIDGFWVLEVGGRAGRPQAEDRTPWCEHVVFAFAHAAVGEARQEVVARDVGAVGVGRTDSDHEWVAGGHPEVFAVAIVAGGDNDHDAGLPSLLDRKRQGVERGGLSGVGPERQVDHADVHPVVVLVLDDPVDGSNDLGDVHGAVVTRDLDVDDAGVGGDADELAVPGVGPRIGDPGVLAGDDAGHVGAVAVGVEVAEVV